MNPSLIYMHEPSGAKLQCDVSCKSNVWIPKDTWHSNSLLITTIVDLEIFNFHVLLADTSGAHFSLTNFYIVLN